MDNQSSARRREVSSRARTTTEGRLSRRPVIQGSIFMVLAVRGRGRLRHTRVRRQLERAEGWGGYLGRVRSLPVYKPGEMGEGCGEPWEFGARRGGLIGCEG